MNTYNSITNEVVDALRHLILHFIERQQIVIQAMIQFRPDLIRSFEIDKTLGIEIEAQYQYFLKNYLGNDDIFQGIWNKDWRYRLHGHGCKLENINTNEPLEWDAGDPLAFDLNWFGTHLDWRIQREMAQPYIKTFLDWRQTSSGDMRQLLNYFIESNFLIRKPEQTGWLLNI
jgi:hypothetical protein